MKNNSQGNVRLLAAWKNVRDEWSKEKIESLKELIEKYVHTIGDYYDNIDVGCPHYYHHDKNINVKISWVYDAWTSYGAKSSAEDRMCIKQLNEALKIIDKHKGSNFYTELNQDFYNNLNIFGRCMFMHIAKQNHEWDLIDYVKPYINTGNGLKNFDNITFYVKNYAKTNLEQVFNKNVNPIMLEAERSIGVPTDVENDQNHHNPYTEHDEKDVIGKNDFHAQESSREFPCRNSLSHHRTSVVAYGGFRLIFHKLLEKREQTNTLEPI